MEWHDVAITIGCVLAVFGAINVIGNAVKIIKEWTDPLAKLSERTDELERRADKTDEQYERLKNVITAQSQLRIEMTNHMISGNDIEKLKEKRDDLTRTMME